MTGAARRLRIAYTSPIRDNQATNDPRSAEASFPLGNNDMQATGRSRDCPVENGSHLPNPATSASIPSKDLPSPSSKMKHLALFKALGIDVTDISRKRPD
jgi:hypothetical protein